MKALCNRDGLLAAFGMVSGVVPARTPHARQPFPFAPFDSPEARPPYTTTRPWSDA